VLYNFWLPYSIYTNHTISSSSSKDWKNKLAKLNEAVRETNETERGSKIRPFTEKKILIALGIIVASAGFNCRGCELWAKENNELPASADPKTWWSIIKSPDFGQYLGGKQVQGVPKINTYNLDGNSPLFKNLFNNEEIWLMHPTGRWRMNLCLHGAHRKPKKEAFQIFPIL
jgi:hypothetical protein